MFELSASLADILVTTAATVIPDDDLDDLTCDYGMRKRKRIVSLSGECDFDEEVRSERLRGRGRGFMRTM